MRISTHFPYCSWLSMQRTISNVPGRNWKSGSEISEEFEATLSCDKDWMDSWELISREVEQCGGLDGFVTFTGSVVVLWLDEGLWWFIEVVLGSVELFFVAWLLTASGTWLDEICAETGALTTEDFSGHTSGMSSLWTKAVTVLLQLL